MKIVFMGTPDFSVSVLEGLMSSRHDVISVVTQPDKPKGRGKRLLFSAVKKVALENNIYVLQPLAAKDEKFIQALDKLKPDVIVVAAYGQIIPKQILELPRYGCINVHASLLPRHRGASPIQRAILEGDEITGITIMQMDEGLDTGDILRTKEVSIDERDTGGSLFEKLADVSPLVLLETLDLIERGETNPMKQDDSKASYAPRLSKSDGVIDCDKDVNLVANSIRAMNPWPSSYTYIDGELLKIWEAVPVVEDIDKKPYEVIEVANDYFSIACKNGYIKVYEVQRQNKKRMRVQEFLRGFKIETGDIFTKFKVQ